MRDLIILLHETPKGRQVEFGKFGLEGFSRVKKSVNFLEKLLVNKLGILPSNNNPSLFQNKLGE